MRHTIKQAAIILVSIALLEVVGCDASPKQHQASQQETETFRTFVPAGPTVLPNRATQRTQTLESIPTVHLSQMPQEFETSRRSPPANSSTPPKPYTADATLPRDESTVATPIESSRSTSVVSPTMSLTAAKTPLATTAVPTNAAPRTAPPVATRSGATPTTNPSNAQPTAQPIRQSPTVTPTAPASPTLVPTQTPGNLRCSQSGTVTICAWVSDPTPQRNRSVAVYARLLDNGVGTAALPLRTVWQYKATTSACEGQTDIHGVASCARNIGRATIAFSVSVDATISYRGRAYSVTTFFTPRS
ncbi:MAG: hypothetical protein EPO21_12790 [Chloroflexota bacterium]|nr:MAG: hypothetical protein EPO21_12790 [Chloroflexota bacterium]